MASCPCSGRNRTGRGGDGAYGSHDGSLRRRRHHASDRARQHWRSADTWLLCWEIELAATTTNMTAVVCCMGLEGSRTGFKICRPALLLAFW